MQDNGENGYFKQLFHILRMFSILIQKFALGIFLPKLLNVTSSLKRWLTEGKEKRTIEIRTILNGI